MTKKEIIENVRKKKSKNILIILLANIFFAPVSEFVCFFLVKQVDIETDVMNLIKILIIILIPFQIICGIILYCVQKKQFFKMKDEDILNTTEAKNLINYYGIKEDENIFL